MLVSVLVCMWSNIGVDCTTTLPYIPLASPSSRMTPWNCSLGHILRVSSHALRWVQCGVFYSESSGERVCRGLKRGDNG